MKKKLTKQNTGTAYKWDKGKWTDEYSDDESETEMPNCESISVIY